MKATIAARCGLPSALGLALVLVAGGASAQPAPPAEAVEPTNSQTDEPPTDPQQQSEDQPAEAEPSERPEQVEKPAETDEGTSVSAAPAGEPSPGRPTQADRAEDGPRETVAPRDTATGRDVPQDRVLGEHRAPATVPKRGPVESAPPRTPWGIELGLGPQVAWVPDDSFDLFADSGHWSAFSARVGVSIWDSGPLDIGVSGVYQYAATDGAVRDAPTELMLHRFLVGGQARYHLLSWFAPHARLLAGLSYLTSELRSGREDETLTLSSPGFTALASAGVGARIIEAKRSGVSVHLYVDGGGSFTTNTRLVYEMGSGAPPRAESADLGTLSLTGPHMEIGALALF